MSPIPARPRTPHPWRRSGIAALAAAAVALVAVVGASADPSIEQKRAQAQAIIAEIQRIDGEVGDAAERWNGATVELARLREQLTETRRALAGARDAYAEAQARSAALLRELYVGGDRISVLEVMLGATSLDDVLAKLDLANRVAKQDIRIVREADALRLQVAAEERGLEAATARQATVVGLRAAEKRAIEGQLAKRQRLLASVKGEIQRMEEAERQRQAELRRQALLELERQRRIAEEQRLAEERRLEAARREAARQAAERAAAARVEAERAAAAKDQAEPPRDIAPVPSAPAPRTTTGDDPVPAPADGAAGAGTVTEAPPVSIGPAPPADAVRGAEVVSIALRYLGTPYVWGAADPSIGFDCSGLVAYVYGRIGISLPHFAAAQYGYGVAVSRDQLALGDLVFFHDLGHMGIYIGGGNFVHAPHTGDVVKISSLSEPYYASTWEGARRVL